MEPVDFKRAYYIKLGHKGKWAKSSISESKLRIAWRYQDVKDINGGDWEKIYVQLLQEALGKDVKDINGGDWKKIYEQLLQEASGKKATATKWLNALRVICESTSEDLWIAFYQNTMWWCRLGCKKVFQDETSKYRKVDGKWYSEDVRGNVLSINDIGGKLAKIQGFQGTVCSLGERETEALKRLLNAKPSPEYLEIDKCENKLSESVQKGIKGLHWKDFETLVDLVFRESGWRRLSMKGGTMKFMDLELEDPITKERYLVQIKSQATYDEFNSFANQFHLHPPIRWLYFVVHSPDEKLAALQKPPPNVKLIGPDQLSEMVVRLGLVDWLKAHIK